MALEQHREGRICLDFGTAFSKASVALGAAEPSQNARPLGIGAAAGAAHALLAPSVLFVDEGRILLGPPALARAKARSETRDPIISFKTILAAHDLEAALSLKLKPSIDPTGSLRQRDAFIIYLAYLDQLVRAAIAAEHLPSAIAETPRRYTSPIWRTRDEADRVMARLFDEAAIVSSQVGAMLLDVEGVSIAQAKGAIARSESTLGIGQLEKGVFEAHAAAAAHAAFSQSTHKYFFVIDMGAGTTDLAAFERSQEGGPVLDEILQARQSCGLAGDEIDEILVAGLLDKARIKDREAQAALWRALRLSARDLKRDLFQSGRCHFETRGAKLKLRREDLMSAPRFHAFTRALGEIVTASVRALASRAAREDDDLLILLAGGGANLPFMGDLASRAGAAAGGRCKIEIERFGESWRLPAPLSATLGEALPQAAISLGGALAELESRPRTATALA